MKKVFLLFFLQAFGLEEKKIVVLIPSYNNAPFYQENLNSVLFQNYSNYRVIYVDDLSSDGTGDLVKNYVKEVAPDTNFMLIKNTERKLALRNFYDVIHSYCDDDEIIIVVDGDDELKHNDVLSRINSLYSNNNVWFTHGSCIFKSNNQRCSWGMPIPDSIIEKNEFRAWPHGPTHLRTFYAWLFKKIRKEDLQIFGKFFPVTYDVAMFLPMLEMAGDRHMFVSEVLYVYNDMNPLNDHKVRGLMQRTFNTYIRKCLASYKKLKD